MNTRTNFIHWYFNEFQLDPLYQAMAETVEDSPWHRERNVGVHTDMVVSQYLSFQDDDFDVRGALGCAFHDVGKPPCEIIKFKPERGEYRAYHGHELVSARMFEDWAVKNWKLLTERFGLEVSDLYTIGWMIEHHVPWATKKDDKLNAFANTAQYTIGKSETWADMLMADQTGRMSDDSHDRITQCREWIGDHFDRVERAEHRWTQYGDKEVYMLIGAPGCGKTTFREELVSQLTGMGEKYAIVNMDELRLEWYGGPYDDAFQKSTKDKKFGAKVDKFYIETLRENNVVILDNTNTAAKARKRWLAPARARDFRINAVLFPVDLQTIRDRQRTRGDKVIPQHVVDNMYNRMSLPMIGDFDTVTVDEGNLK